MKPSMNNIDMSTKPKPNYSQVLLAVGAYPAESCSLWERHIRCNKEHVMRVISAQNPTYLVHDSVWTDANLERALNSFQISRITVKIGIRALSYRELGCISDMSNSDELRHSDNTTLIPPRLPDTLPQVYHRRRPTLRLLILPSVLPFPPTIKRTARMSVLPIEPNLAERARISAINLDDYQLNPLTPPPPPSSPFSMSSVPILETALTICTTSLRGQLHTILEDMDHYPNSCLKELESFMTLWDVKPRVEESSLETLSMDELITQLRQMCEDAEDHASKAQEEAR
ncbi:hypothetical protein Tco_0868650 [Tanacetum coccineum]